jgi:cephalosporin hydroxylase
MPVKPEDMPFLDHNGHPIPLYSPEGFDALSQLWMQVGWSVGYPFAQSWMGFPLIQFPQDVMRMQNLITQEQPTLIIETGVSGGGSMAMYAHLALVYGGARVVGIEKTLRPQQMQALAAHPILGPHITVIQGDSTDPAILPILRAHTQPQDWQRVCVVLDSSHRYDHVLKELRLYGPLVTVGSFVMVMDGALKDMAHVPNGKPRWETDNPHRAVQEFLQESPAFVLDTQDMHPPYTFIQNNTLKIKRLDG